MWFTFWIFWEPWQKFSADLRMTDLQAFGRSYVLILSNGETSGQTGQRTCRRPWLERDLRVLVFQLNVLPARPSKRIICTCKKSLCPCSLCLDDDSSYSDDFECTCDLGGSEVQFYLQPTSIFNLSLCRDCWCFRWPWPYCLFNGTRLWEPCARWICCHMGLPGHPQYPLGCNLSLSKLDGQPWPKLAKYSITLGH